MTPLFSAMDRYVKKSATRFHMPGHKGNLPYLNGVSAYDITEIDGCDSLYEAESAIAETEKKYAEIYGSEASLISAGGSTLCIQTMLSLALAPRDKLICGRGCHISAINAMALLDLEPCWVFPETDESTGLVNAVTAEQIRASLKENPGAKAVYVTSPDYYGAISDVAEISKVCREFQIPLLVDGAHGAHLRFLSPSMHPINLGADICCDSLHKTLPVLTGGAMLHIGNKKYIRDAKRYMSIFGSTSPSYLIMMSIDKALEMLFGDYAARFAETVAEVGRLEKIAENAGFLIPKGLRDLGRLTLGFGQMGYHADEFLKLMRESGIEPEMTSESFCVLMASPSNSKNDFERLEGFVTALPKRTPAPVKLHDHMKPKRVKSLRDSVLAKVREIPLDRASGEVAGSVVAPCPPGIPLVIPGELIDENLMLYLKSYGISYLNVIE